jgi:hypothetical protein
MTVTSAPRATSRVQAPSSPTNATPTSTAPTSATTSPAPTAASPSAAPREPASAATQAGARQRAATLDPAWQAQLDKLKAGDIKGAANGALDKGLDAASRASAALDDPRVKDAYNAVLDKAIDRVTKDWSPREKQALTRSLDTLDELAGGDGKLNHGDKMAVIGALTSDTQGLIKEAHAEIDRRLPRKGLINQVAKNVVERSFQDTRRFRRTGRTGPIQRARMRRREKIKGAAAGVIDRELSSTLQKLGVDPRTAKKLDAAPRALTFDRMRALEGDVAVLQNKLGSTGEGVAALRDRLQAQLDGMVRLDGAPLAAGVPSPRDPRAVVETAIDIGERLELGR